MKWHGYITVVLFILIGVGFYYLSIGIKNNSAAIKEHNHDEKYISKSMVYLDARIEDRVESLRNDRAFGKNMPTHEVLRKVMYHFNLSIKDGNIFKIDDGTDYTKTKGLRGKPTIGGP